MKFSKKTVNEFTGQRLDKFLCAVLTKISRNQIQKRFKLGGVLVNGRVAKPALKLSFGDEVVLKELEASENEFKDFVCPDIPIVLEREEYFVVDKPAGMLTHIANSSRNFKNTVVFAMRDRINIDEFQDKLRPGIVHRLDKQTSGLLLVCKTKKAYDFFVDSFKNRLIKKYYKALVFGALKEKEGYIDSPIGRDLRNRKRMSVFSQSGKEAKTYFKVVKEYSLDGVVFSLLDIRLFTGRTHQIRVHMAAIGHPVVGDTLYGNKGANSVFFEKLGGTRLFLHAYRLVFKDFSSSDVIDVKSALSKDLLATLERFSS